MFSRLTGGRSFYEELHRNPDDLDDEERIGLELDQENLNQHFQDEDLDHAEGLGDSQATIQSDRVGASNLRGWRDDEADNDVPASLLVEPHTATAGPSTQPNPGRANTPRQIPIPGPSNRRTRAQWEATQAQQRLHRDDTFESSASTRPKKTPPVRGIVTGNIKEKTMWKWANVTNIDAFLTDVYNYYQGAGIWCILLDRALMLVQIVFVASLLTFLTQCVDYSKISQDSKIPQDDKQPKEIIIEKCTSNMSWKWNFLLWMWTFYFVVKVIQYVMDLRTLFWMRDFYTHLLNISDDDIQTITWQDIVAKLMALRDSHPIVAPVPRSEAQRKFMKVSRERMDAHDIANRLMRKENYIIAIFNKDLLDLSPPLPFLRNYQFYSKHLEWWLWLSIMDFVFQSNGTVRQEFLQASRRGQLSQKLKERFTTYAIFSVFFSPVTAVYNLTLHSFKYLREYQKNPSRLGARAYTPLAEWKFREFNELEHFFRDRVNMSYPFATHYIDQFPKVKMELISRTVAFISGALAAILAVVTVFHSEHFLEFEITKGRTVLFYTTLFTTIWAAANGNLSEETKVFDPEYTMNQVIEYTHYQPDHWKGRLHGYDVKTEFSQLYKPRIVIFLEEIVGILMTPIILAFCLPKCADQIIDFFREFTIHVDGVGYVCYFAEFKFNTPAGGKKAVGEADDVRDDYYATKHGKMHSSYVNFLDNYVVNPKTGIAGSQRAMFHPPPAFPGLQSPTLAADMQSSRLGRSERARSRPPHSEKTPRFRPHMPQPSPMASMLLDPHHQPTASSLMARTVHPHRTARSGYVGDGIIEESEDEEEPKRTVNARQGRVQDVETDEPALELGESVWETSPMKGLSRENSGAVSEEDTSGVLGLVRQLQQAQMDNRR